MKINEDEIVLFTIIIILNILLLTLFKQSKKIVILSYGIFISYSTLCFIKCFFYGQGGGGFVGYMFELFFSYLQLLITTIIFILKNLTNSKLKVFLYILPSISILLYTLLNYK